MPPKPKRKAFYGQLPDTTTAPPPKRTGPRGPPKPQQPANPDHYRQADRNIEDHGWDQMEPYEFTLGSYLPRHLTTWAPNNLALRDMNWYPVDLRQ